METRKTRETMPGQATVTGRPAARAARWFDPDSLDVCAGHAWADVASDVADVTLDRDELATPPLPQTFQLGSQAAQTEHRRPARVRRQAAM